MPPRLQDKPGMVPFSTAPAASLQTKIHHLNTVLEDYADKLKLGDFIVVTPGQIRVAGSPRA